ncbi:MAG: N-6 DNA methylase [Armatimonadetes bacterium]|nr:N-6 DNA methylase [Armatimonadota bacterium]
MNPVETYISELREIRAYGAAVEETSCYGALENLLNEIGKTLKPKVRCIINLRNAGAGFPDGGLFTPDQKSTDLIEGQIPSRGVIEIKGIGDEVSQIAETEQVERYLRRYGQVLVTNYWDFLLVGRSDGKPVKLECYHLAESEAAFRAGLAHPRRMDEHHKDLFPEYLKRVMLRAAELTDPKDVAQLLASYAREARVHIESAGLPALETVRTALEEALGLRFEKEKGEHFFRSTLIQTLFYGMFSAWVLWSRKQRDDDGSARFEWRTAAWELHVPMIKALFEQVAAPTRLESLGLVEILDWAAAALNRVDRRAFFDSFEKQHAVQYFYEPFLEAYDPQLRKDLGVWYTPQEIVEYMVARVDTALREELEIEDGLADPNVYVLDPACGTGAYLVEALKRIEATLRDKGGGALVGAEVKRAAMSRVFGFEILPAPFVVSHLQLGLLLQNLNAPLATRGERVGVYLTNSLTGWEPPTEEVKRRLQQLQLSFPELKEERDAAQKVKNKAPILVVLGNPPYNAFAGVATDPEEKRLVEPYKEGLISEWGIKKFNLDELYVRFFRLAERRIAEMTGMGVVCYISNYSWISDPSFVVLRKHLLDSFDRFWIENMHGDRRISEYAPDGRTSETVFAISGFSVGIQQGVAISLWVKKGKMKKDGPQVLFRDDLNDAKASERRAQLLNSLNSRDFDGHYVPANPKLINRFSFRPMTTTANYQEWPKVVDLCAVSPSNGLMEKRGGALIDIDRKKLETRIWAYFDQTLDWEAYKTLGYGLTKNQARFVAKSARIRAIAAEQFLMERIVRYALRPFDSRWCYYTRVRPVWNEPRPSLWAQHWPGNTFLIARFKAAKHPEGPPLYYTSCLIDDHFLAPDAVAIPLRIKNGRRLDRHDQASLFSAIGDTLEEETPVADLSEAARTYLAQIGIGNLDADASTASLIWMHALAIGYSPAYLTENADGIRQDWPRIPLPDSKDLLLASAELGRKVAALLDTENTVPGVTSGDIRQELRSIGVISREGGGSLNPQTDLAVTVGWGHPGKDGITMPGKGKVVEREYTPEEVSAIRAGASILGLSSEEAFAYLGETTMDIYLNDIAYWKNVPAGAWNYTIGGYQVVKKWLSYRESDLLGRPLTVDEVNEVRDMARRIAAILLLDPALDANYADVKKAVYAWPLSN